MSPKTLVRRMWICLLPVRCSGPGISPPTVQAPGSGRTGCSSTWPTSWPARSTLTASWPWRRKSRVSGQPRSRRCLLSLARELTEAQHGNVARMIRLGGGANFSVPGSGKTAMACATWAALRQLGDVDRMLVVAPLSAHEAWATEPSEVFGVPVPTVAIRPLRPGPEDIFVVNYERLESQAQLDASSRGVSVNRALVVFDEAHRAKRGAAGVRGAAALTLSRTARRPMVAAGRRPMAPPTSPRCSSSPTQVEVPDWPPVRQPRYAGRSAG